MVLVVARDRPEDRRLRPVVLAVGVAKAAEEWPVGDKRQAARRQRQPHARPIALVDDRPRELGRRERQEREDGVVVDRDRRDERQRQHERPERRRCPLPGDRRERQRARHQSIRSRLDRVGAVEHRQQRQDGGDRGRHRVGITPRKDEQAQARQWHRDDRGQTETDEFIGDQPRERPLDHVEPRRAVSAALASACQTSVIEPSRAIATVKISSNQKARFAACTRPARTM